MTLLTRIGRAIKRLFTKKQPEAPESTLKNIQVRFGYSLKEPVEQPASNHASQDAYPSSSFIIPRERHGCSDTCYTPDDGALTDPEACCGKCQQAEDDALSETQPPEFGHARFFEDEMFDALVKKRADEARAELLRRMQAKDDAVERNRVRAR